MIPSCSQARLFFLFSSCSTSYSLVLFLCISSNRSESSIVLSLFNIVISMSQTSFSLYLHNQWTDFHKLSYTGKPQMRDIHICMGCTKVITNDWDIRPLVAVKALSANISWTAEQIRMIKLALKSAHWSVYNNIWCVSINTYCFETHHILL